MGSLTNEEKIPLLAEGKLPPLPPIHLPLTPEQVTRLQTHYGRNVLGTEARITWYSLLVSNLAHPFNILLLLIATGSALTADYDAMTVMIVMVIFSTLLRFRQEWAAAAEIASLLRLVSNTVRVIRFSHEEFREPVTQIVPIEELVPSDWVQLGAGDLIPADLQLFESKNLYVLQSTLTGEPHPVEKAACTSSGVAETAEEGCTTSLKRARAPSKRVKFQKYMTQYGRHMLGLRTEHGFGTARMDRIKADLDRSDLCYMGTSVVSGTATGFVLRTGPSTYFGTMTAELSKLRPPNAFQLGVRRISWIFFLTMAVMVPPVFLIQGLLNQNWTDALLFALAMAVGLTPEMLPMIVSTALAQGAYVMSKQLCIVKNLDSIINLGGMDVLCTDKTGTLTESHVVLKNPDSELALRLAYLNANFQAGLVSLIDSAIIDFHTAKFGDAVNNLAGAELVKVDELPFDFVRRRMSVLLEQKSKEHVQKQGLCRILISKGAVDEMLAACTHVHCNSESNEGTREVKDDDAASFEFPGAEARILLTDEERKNLLILNNDLNGKGLRVIAVGYKIMAETEHGRLDESGITFAGFLSFDDPPKASSTPAMRHLLELGVHVKVLTGDSAAVTARICADIGLPLQPEQIVSGAELDRLGSESEFKRVVEGGVIFTKVTPLQKAAIVRSLKYGNHIVGFLGDGINDAPALNEADIGISVDTGAEVAKQTADMILLDKDLCVVANAVLAGRRTYGNTLKYIVMATSSNFGNIFSMLVASAWLSFLPMLPIHVLTQNLLYDISQVSIPWDSLDPEFLAVPHRWRMRSVLTFMTFIGPWSSLFDIATFGYLYYGYGIQSTINHDKVLFFQTAWFTLGILTQISIIHMIRSPKLAFVRTRASATVVWTTLAVTGLALVLPYVPGLHVWLDMVQLDLGVYTWILGCIGAYFCLTQAAKTLYVALFKEWF